MTFPPTPGSGTRPWVYLPVSLRLDPKEKGLERVVSQALLSPRLLNSYANWPMVPPDPLLIKRRGSFA